MKTKNCIFLGLGIIVGSIGLYFLNKKVRKCSKEKIKENADEKKRAEEIKDEMKTEKIIKERIYSEIKSKVKGKKSTKDIVRIIVPEIIENYGPRNRSELTNVCIRILVETVPFSKLNEVPKNIEELEELIGESGMYETYETYLEQIYSKK